jgi:hypothetical protein
MGASLNIFRLYRLPEAAGERHLLAKSERPEFANWSQSAEDEARDEVERRFRAIIAREAGGQVELIASWEGAHPEGDCFYQSASGIELDIWFALDTIHRGYFVFGAHQSEADFWNCVEGLSRDGEICDVSEYARPARRARVRFVQ